MMKKRTIVVVAVILCFVCNMTAMAFSRADDYAIGPNETEMIASYVPGTSVVRFNTRPRSGGEMTVTLKGAVNASASFPYYTSRTDWVVRGVDKSSTLYINGTATSSGSAGTLRSWSE